jgi:CBS domain-containing protein
MDDRIKLFNSPVISISKEQTLQDALFSMRKNKIRHLVVAHKSYPIGIITERDIAQFLENDYLRRTTTQILVQDAMIKNMIKIVTPTDDLLKKCAQKMNHMNIGSVVIIDKDNQLGGIVTKAIFVHNYPWIFENKFKVSHFMSRAVITCRPDDDVGFAFKTMRRHQVSRLVVTDNKGAPIGIITYQDFLNSNLALDSMNDVSYENMFVGNKDKQVFDVMEKNVLYVKASDDMSVATKIMEKYGISGAPVVDEDGVLEGMVSSSDIVKIFI